MIANPFSKQMLNFRRIFFTVDDKTFFAKQLLAKVVFKMKNCSEPEADEQT